MSFSMLCEAPPLVLEPAKLRDALGVIEVDDLPDPQPECTVRAKDATPLIERLWRIALADVESNIVRNGHAEYFGAGDKFGLRIYTRDISYSGLLGLNRLYPDLMRKSLEHTREVRRRLGFTVSQGHQLDAIDVDWNIAFEHEPDLLATHHTNSYTRRTDDVVWLWCAQDLFADSASPADWKWLYETGNWCFKRFYEPFFDPEDGLYRGQATFVDAHHPNRHHKATGYPQDWEFGDCILLKATCTNCLYVKGLEVMADCAGRLGLEVEAAAWLGRATALKAAIRRELRRPDGTFAYYKDRHGRLADRRAALGSAFAVLLGIVEGQEAKAALAGYPVTDAGIPLFHPFFPPTARTYHNQSSWPFVDTFF
ncbi:MAG: hypothetical protein NTW86_21240, partial [Candidatus Sumerlaeota bacterium]|nr:hypothetical protein [Candidatus Sumerlaeota bacterium]